MKVLNLLLHLIIVFLHYLGNKIRLKFRGSCLKQNKLTYNHRKIVNIYIVYELGASSSLNTDSTLKNSLFGAVELTKNADIDNYWYSGYGIRFVIFHADINSSVHIDNKGKDILILGNGPTQGLGEHPLIAEKMYSITFKFKLFNFNFKILFKFALQCSKQLFIC